MNEQEKIGLILAEFRKALENIKVIIETYVLIEDDTQNRILEIDKLKKIVQIQQDKINELEYNNNLLLDKILDLELSSPEYF